MKKSSTKAGSVSKKDSKSSKGKQTQEKDDSGTVWVEPAKFSEEEESDEPEYEVEEIVGKKVKRGVIYYQVKWKGFSLDDATWEPEENLDHAPLKIRAYENSLLNSGTTAAVSSTTKDKKGKPEASTSVPKANGKDSAATNKLSALASSNESEGLLGKRARDTLDKEAEQEDKKKNKNSVGDKKATTNGEQKEEKTTKKVDRRSLEEKSKIDEDAKKGEKAGDKGKKTIEEEKETDSKQQKKMDEEKSESTKGKKGEQAASTSQQEAQASGSDNKAAGEANQAGDSASGTRGANKDEGISLSRIMQDDKLMEGSETEEPSINEHREAETPEPNKGKKNKQKEQGEYGSLEKDIPLKVIGIRPVKEENDLEVMVSWKPRENGVKPYNSKIMRLALLKKGHWMPLIEFYESKMKLESAPNFDPNMLPRCNP